MRYHEVKMPGHLKLKVQDVLNHTQLDLVLQNRRKIKSIRRVVAGFGAFAAVLVISASVLYQVHTVSKQATNQGIKQPNTTPATVSAANVSSPLQESSLPLTKTPMDTPDFRQDLIQALKAPEHTKSWNGTDISVPINVQNLSVRWSKIEGSFGYAVVVYTLNQQNYLSGVIAMRGMNSHWLVYELNQSPPLTQQNLHGFGIYNGEASGQFQNPVRPYMFIYGIVLNPKITYILLTWTNGTTVKIPVVNGSYGYNINQGKSLPGPSKIEGYNAQGRLEWSQ
jgi:hypothetical protein